MSVACNNTADNYMYIVNLSHICHLANFVIEDKVMQHFPSPVVLSVTKSGFLSSNFGPLGRVKSHVALVVETLAAIGQVRWNPICFE